MFKKNKPNKYLMSKSVSQYYRNLKITPLKNRQWKLLENYKFGSIIVPKGYITNGADIPRIFWSFIPPNDTSILPAVVLHDYLIDNNNWLLANQIFESMLNKLKIGKFKKFVLVFGVNLRYRYLQITNQLGDKNAN